MPRSTHTTVNESALVLTCSDLQANVDFFIEVGFRLERISPADDPQTAILSGHGLRICLERTDEDRPGWLRIHSSSGARERSSATAPNGTRVEFATTEQEEPLPPLPNAPILSFASQAGWENGRAGMRYRDLIPGRLGGRLIASRIHIEEGGPVSDYVHHHAVDFQLIYCASGWVRVVYQDQGEPFVLNAGDCVLQPPGIRHRVLESSAGLEVIEVASPARHDTFVDHTLDLPTPKNLGKSYGGQRFVHHLAGEATWETSVPSLSTRDLGLASATDGLVNACVHRLNGNAAEVSCRSLGSGEPTVIRFLHVLAGEVTTAGIRTAATALRSGDSLALPLDQDATLSAVHDVELLHIEVRRTVDVTT